MSLILLAGGKGTRLNADKALLELNEIKIIENTIQKLNNLFNSIIIVDNYNLEKYDSIINKYNKIIITQDLIKNKGPLGGIYTGLKTAKDDLNFILACDMPFINIDLIKYMLSISKYDAVIPKNDDKIEPLYSVYNKRIIPIIENQIKNNNLKIRDMINKIEKIKFIENEEIRKFDKDNICFFNINTKKDLEKAGKLVKQINF